MTRRRARLAALGSRFLPSGDLATRTVRSGAWMTALNVSRRGFELVTLVFLARLLSPDDFGLIGIALLTLTALQRFSNLGLNAALIQREEENVDHYLDTAFTLQLARGAVLAAITFALAGPAARFFGAPAVEPILQVVALTPLLVGFENPGVVYFQKDLAFHRQFVHLVSTSVVYFVVTVTLALIDGTVWALVIGYVASSLSETLVSYVVHDYRPTLAFDRAAASDLIGFGKWLTLSGVVYFLVEEGDDFVVGWLLTAASLGFYRLAYRLALTPATELTNVVSTVMFPAYSKLKGDVAAVRAGFLRTVQLTTALTFPMGVGIAVVAPPFVEAVLGEQWGPMVAALQILSAYGLVLSLASSFGPVWLAMGRPDYPAKVGIGRVLVTAVLIVPATLEYGIVGTGAVVVLAYLVVGLPADLYLATSLLDMSLGRFAGELAYPVAASAAMGALVWWARESLDVGSAALELVVLVAFGAAVYAALAVVLMRGLGWGLERNVREVLRAFSG